MKWDTAYVNDLPDSAFAYVEPGEKDDEGKTVPRSKRHLPYKGSDGKPDADHVRNALARLPQTEIPGDARSRAESRLKAAAKELGIEVGKAVDVNEESVRIRQRDPSEFEQESFRTISLTAGVKAVVGRLHGQTSTTIQTLIFDRKKFSREQAEAWAKEHMKGKAASDGPLTFYAPIEKLDEDLRMVWGYASTPDLDVQGDRIALQAMSDSLEEYMKFANIREMHSPSAVGKAKSAEVDDVGMYIGAKIVDDVAWRKVKEKVYSGFSVGGYATDRIDDWIVGLRLTEISLVDRPANPRAVIDVWKSSGGGGFTVNELEKILEGQKAIADAVTKLSDAVGKIGTVRKDGGDGGAGVGGGTGGDASTRELELEAKVDELTKKVDEDAKLRKAETKKKLLDAGAAAGKFRVADRRKWETLYDTNPTLCAEMLKAQPVVVAIGDRRGTGADAEDKTSIQRFDDMVEEKTKELMQVDKLDRPRAWMRAVDIVAKKNPELYAARTAESLQAAAPQISGIPPIQ